MSCSRPVPLLVLLCSLGAGCALSREDDAADSSTPPNIVVILADDMGYGDPACFNPQSRIPTPHIDRLAQEGMRFTDAHAPGALCVPSRYGLLTGRYPFRRRHFRPGQEAVIDATRVTLASFLRDQGYATAMVGKWHLGFDGGPATAGEDLTGGPVDRGFEQFFGIHASLDIPPYYYIRGRTPVAPPTGTIAASHTDGWTDIQGAFWRAGDCAPGFVHGQVLPRFTKEAVQYLDDRTDAGDRPFFLYLALPAPHTPWLPDPPFRQSSGAGMYGDFVAQVDAAVGRILETLDRNDQTRRTLVFFTSDNGPVWYPADVERLGHRSTGPWRGMKADAWEGGHRMPFAVRWPGRVESGSVCSQTICFTDLLATFADVVGAPLPAGAGEDSHSLWPVLHDAAARTTREWTVLKANASAIRAGRWKLIKHLGSGGFSRPRRTEATAGEPPGQLYDLETDPGETHNLWSERPEVVARLTRALAETSQE